MSLPDGWLSAEEAEELRRLARAKTVLELGAWKGRSTVVLAEVAAYVVSVDRHRGIPEGGEDSLPDYLSAVRGLDNVAVVIASFDDVVPLLGSFDLVYVDGDHDERSARECTGIAAAHANSGGIVAFHDWDMQPVRDGVRKVFRRSPQHVVGSVAWFVVP